MPTFPALLDRRLRDQPSRPFITFYDDATGERTELSVQTYANWVSKTANLLSDELMLDPGAAIAVALPPHWLGTVFLGAAWSCGLRVDVAGEDPELVVVGPDEIETGGIDAETGPGAPIVLACSLLPFAVRFAGPLPPGVLDYGVLWPGQADVFVPTEPAELPETAPSGERLLTDVDPLGEQGRALLLAALAGSGSLVLLRNAGADRWPARYESERATGVVRTGLPDQPIS